MKKHIILLALSVTMIGIQAQVSLTYEKHAYRIGDKHDFIVAGNISHAGNSGANVTWDFSGLVQESSFTSMMVDPLVTEKGAQVPAANLALIENGNVFYFLVNKEKVQQCASSNVCFLFHFDKPFDKMRFPFRYGDVFTGTFSGVSATGDNRVNTGGSYLIEGDAWGTLILPNGIYKKTLRVKQTRLLQGDTGETTETTYRWYSNEMRYPLLVVITQESGGVASTSKVAYSAHYPVQSPVKEKESESIKMLSEIHVGVSPNPFMEYIRVNYQLEVNTPVSVELLNSAGNVVQILQPPVAKEAGSYSENFTVQVPVGSYYLRVTTRQQIVVKKIVKI